MQIQLNHIQLDFLTDHEGIVRVRWGDKPVLALIDVDAVMAAVLFHPSHHHDWKILAACLLEMTPEAFEVFFEHQMLYYKK